MGLTKPSPRATVLRHAESTVNPRSKLLLDAEKLVNEDRNVQYGDPSADFKRTAAFWNTYLSGVFERRVGEAEVSDGIREILHSLIQPHDMSVMMVLLKLSRISWSPDKEDSWADAAGYVACGYGCTLTENL